ncbi:MAG TPA: GAF domain-containing protein [Azospirillum sp.]
MTTPEDASPADAVARLRRYQEILNDFGRLAAEARELAQLLQLACVQAARGLGIRHTKVMRYRPSMGDLLMEAGVGWKPGLVGHATFGTDVASPPGRALQSRQPVSIEGLPDNADFRYSSILRDHGIVSVVNAPVTVDGMVWGVLEIDSEVPRHFSRDDITFLCALAGVLGLAIQGRLLEKKVDDVVTRSIAEAERQKVLMRELVHRDKNDFQRIMAILLTLQAKQTDPQARQGFAHAIDRVMAISLAHDQLAMHPDRESIDLAGYLQALCGSLRQRSENVGVEVQVDAVELPHERAVALGLITNELVTNAIKYAFPNGGGTVRVAFTIDRARAQGTLIVADDGVGMGAPRQGSSGLQLVEALARQLGGAVERPATSQGTVVRIAFVLVTSGPAQPAVISAAR